MKKNRDISVYTQAQREVLELLEKYPKEEIEDAVLYIVDAEAISFLKETKKLLELEFSMHDEERERTSSKRRGRPLVQEYSLDTIVKVVNPDAPANAYQTFVAESWRQINDRDKVFNSIEGEFAKYRNSIRAATRRKLKEQKADKSVIDEVMRNIDAEIAQAEKEKEYILENFEKLDVRISAYEERVKYAALRWYVKKKKQTDVNLRKQVPNALWFEKLTPEEELRANNELVYYLSKAKRAFGYVYYKELEEK